MQFGKLAMCAAGEIFQVSTANQASRCNFVVGGQIGTAGGHFPHVGGHEVRRGASGGLRGAGAPPVGGQFGIYVLQSIQNEIFKNIIILEDQL